MTDSEVSVKTCITNLKSVVVFFKVMYTFLIKGPSRLFGCTYTSVYHFSFQKKITLSGSRLMFLLTKSECVAPDDICTQHTFMHGQKFQVSGVGGSKEKKTSMWGKNIFLKKTMSEKSLITHSCMARNSKYQE